MPQISIEIPRPLSFILSLFERGRAPQFFNPKRFDAKLYLERTFGKAMLMPIDLEVLEISYTMLAALGVIPGQGFARGRVFGPGPSIMEEMRFIPFMRDSAVFELIEPSPENRRLLKAILKGLWIEIHKGRNVEFIDVVRHWAKVEKADREAGLRIFPNVSPECFADIFVKAQGMMMVMDGSFHESHRPVDVIGGDSSFCSHSDKEDMVRHALHMALADLDPEGMFNFSFVLGSSKYKAGKYTCPQFPGTLQFYEEEFETMQKMGLIGPFLIQETVTWDSDDGEREPGARRFAVVAGRGRDVALAA